MIATPPSAPLMPPNNLPSAAADRLFVMRRCREAHCAASPSLLSRQCVYLSCALVRTKEQQLIALDRSANIKAELILFEFRLAAGPSGSRRSHWR